MTISEIFRPLNHEQKEEIKTAIIYGEWEEVFFLCGKYDLSLQDAQKLKYYGEYNPD